MIEKRFYSMGYVGWKDLKSELVQNTKKELNIDAGDVFNGVPHYTLLKQGFFKGNINVDNTKSSIATQYFIDSILGLMKNTNPCIVAGGVYTLESSAVPKLNMVYTSVWSSQTAKEPIGLTLYGCFFVLLLESEVLVCTSFYQRI